MSTWYITAMKESDIDTVLEIENSSFDSPWGLKSYQDELTCRDSYCYTIRLGNRKIIAFICFRLFIDEMHLMKLAVTPALRGLGVALWTLEKCINLSRKAGATIAYLEVRPSNNAGIELYKKLGFQIAGIRPGYFSDNMEDALIMVKKFKEE